MAGQWRENGDLHATDIVLRRVGWMIEGGKHDGVIVKDGELNEKLADGPHGGYRPVYIEIGD